MSKLAALLVLLLGIFVGYQLWGTRPAEVRVEYKDRVIEKDVVQWRTQVVTVTKFKDGTTTTTTTNSQVDKVETKEKETTKVSVHNSQSTYSLGISYIPTYSSLLPTSKNIRVELGRRITGPLWLTLGSTSVDSTTQLTLGLRIEF